MDHLRLIALVTLFGIAALAGGSLVRLGIAAVADGQSAAVIGILVIVVLLAIARGARDRQWRENPYW